MDTPRTAVESNHDGETRNVPVNHCPTGRVIGIPLRVPIGPDCGVQELAEINNSINHGSPFQ
jgi:hypothetical protein